MGVLNDEYNGGSDLSAHLAFIVGFGGSTKLGELVGFEAYSATCAARTDESSHKFKHGRIVFEHHQENAHIGHRNLQERVE